MEKITNKKWFKIFEVFIFLFLFALLLLLSSIDRMFIISLIPLCLVFIIFLFSLFKKTKPLFKKCFNKENKKLCFVLTMILIVVVFAVYSYLRVSIDVHRLYVIYGDWNIEMTSEQEQTIKFIYDLMYKRVVLFAGIVFSGTFLVLKSIEKK